MSTTKLFHRSGVMFYGGKSPISQKSARYGIPDRLIQFVLQLVSTHSVRVNVHVKGQPQFNGFHIALLFSPNVCDLGTTEWGYF